jgi:copper transport protein
MLLATTFGMAWVLEQGVLAILFAVLLRALRRSPTGAPGLAVALVGGLLLGLAGVQALTGHVATGPAQETPIRWIALTAHLVAMLAWVGGLAALAIAVGPLLRGPRADIGLARAVLGRFWLVAAPALAVLAVTGLYLGGQLVASADALLLTPYGQALIIKTGLALAAVSLGALNAAALHPGLGGRMRRAAPFLQPLVPSRARLRAVVAVEAGTALVVVLAAAFMSASPPARGPRFEPLPAAVAQAPVAVRADDLLVTLSIRPDRPGPNFADIGVLDTRRPAPAAIDAVTVRLISPTGPGVTTLQARATAPGRYEIDNLPIDAGGAWRLAIEIDRAGLPAATVEIPWAVSPPLSAPHPVLVSDAPLAPIATLLAVALAVLLGGLGIVVVARRRGLRPGRSAAAFAASQPVTRAGSES